jgi:hypothetical protein
LDGTCSLPFCRLIFAPSGGMEGVGVFMGLLYPNYMKL